MPGMTRPVGSDAAGAFAVARKVMAGFRPPTPKQRPAIDYTVPASPGEPLLEARGPSLGGEIAAARAAMRRGECTARQLVEAALAVVASRDHELGAFAELTAEAAREEADRCDRERAAGLDGGPLHGIPLTVKDMLHVAGVPTRCGSSSYQELPRHDAIAVAKVRAAGAVLLGKTTTHEFALGVTTPQARNPHDLERLPGGSSGGSAIAVATGMGLVSLGTDTRASVRVPAALCGVVGFKPTYGHISTGGVVPLSWTMDHVGVLARTVADAALVADVCRTAGAPASPAAGAVVGGLRVGVCEAAFDSADPGVHAGALAAIEQLAALGLAVVRSSRPSRTDLDLASAAGLIISRCEAATFHRSLGGDPSSYWDEVADQLEAAASVAATDYLEAQRCRSVLAHELLAAFRDFDVLAMPTTLVPAPPANDFARYLTLLARNVIPWSLLGFPALTLPVGGVGGGPEKLPTGLQLVAPPGHDPLVIAVASALEQASAA